MQIHKELITKPTLRVMSQGPNNKPKWQTADLEAYALMHSELRVPFKNLCDLTGNIDLYNYVEAISAKQDRKERARLRYILSFPDKGNKSRNIAISDYFTQILLRPIMFCMKDFINKRFEGKSFAHDHSEGFNQLFSWIAPGVKSVDIKSFTEALCAKLQKDVVGHLTNPEIAENWYNLVVDCPWEVRKSKKQRNLPDTVKYARGQGMGTAGSFDIATLTMLLIIEYLFQVHYNIDLDDARFTETGDDLVSWDPENKICDSLTSDLGLEISLAKTKTATEENIVGEYVSRNINYGRDVSRISANICRAVDQNILDIPELARHISERNLDFTLPLKEIFKKQLKEKDWPKYIRTFHMLTLLFPSRPGMKRLRHSLIDSFLEFYETDEFIRQTKELSVMEAFKNTYYLYSSCKLLDSIFTKAENIHDSAVQIVNNPEMLKDLSDAAIWWTNHDEFIAEKTSKLALSESYKALDSIYGNQNSDNHERIRDYSKANDIEDAFERLESIEQKLTFKDLGVIHTEPSKTPYRPKVSRLYNITKNIVFPSYDDLVRQVIENDEMLPLSKHRYLPIGRIYLNDKILLESTYILPNVLKKILKIHDKEIIEHFETP
jgi:hypothetical protein